MGAQKREQPYHPAVDIAAFVNEQAWVECLASQDVIRQLYRIVTHLSSTEL